MATLQSWRKAYGAIKDHTKVGLAHVNSDFKDVDVAIVKATNHVESPPKERHLRKIYMATSAVRPRADVAYCIHALSRRLTKTRNWTVALKTLIVIHRALREGDHTFREELLNFQQRGHVLQMSNFKDDSSPIAWDCSTWVRTYGVFLEERLECFKILKYDIEAERLTRPGSQGQEKGYSRTRELDSEKLLEQLPALQQLLYRLTGCRPEGAAVNNYLIQYALALVLKESFKVYCAINDGIINLVDKFFEMPKHEAMKALDIYKRAGQQAGTLSDFYEVCKGLELARNFQFPVLREPPQSFLATMEEYIKEAPRMVSAPKETLDYPERLMLTYKPDDEAPPFEEETTVSNDEHQLPTTNEVLISNVEAPLQPPTFAPQNHVDKHTADLLGLSNSISGVAAIEEINALALAVVPTSSTSSTFDPLATQSKDIDPTGWELALVTTPSSNISAVNERQLAGGLDTLTLSSLYDDAAYRGSQQQAMYGVPTGPNPFETTDPFAFSNNNIPPPPASEQMASNNPFGFYQQPAYPPQQQQPAYPPQQQQQPAYPPQQQQQPAYPPQQQQQPAYPPQQQQQHQQMMMEPSNPFGDDAGFEAFPTNQVGHQQHAANNNPFGSTGLI